MRASVRGLLAAIVGMMMMCLACSAALAVDQKWPADETLRTSMAAIRKATLDNHTLVTHRRMPPAAAQGFAARIAREASRIKSDAQLTVEARAGLEPLLADIVTGAEAVAGRGGDETPIDGIVRIDAALARYPALFDDPIWQPLR